MPRKVRDVNPGPGAIIREARRDHNLTQSQLAELVGVATSYICEIEGSKSPGLTFALMIKIAVVLDIPMGPLGESAVEWDPALQEFRRDYLQRRLDRITSEASRLQVEAEAVAAEMRELDSRFGDHPKLG